MYARRQCPPTAQQIKLHRVNAARRLVLIRGDYALYLQARYFFGDRHAPVPSVNQMSAS